MLVFYKNNCGINSLKLISIILNFHCVNNQKSKTENRYSNKIWNMNVNTMLAEYTCGNGLIANCSSHYKLQLVFYKLQKYY